MNGLSPPSFLSNEDFEHILTNFHQDHLIRRSCVRDFEIEHFGDARFWDTDSTDESPYGQIAVLKRVCWLDLSTVFTNVVPGRYLVFWKIKLDAFDFSGTWKAGVGSRVKSYLGAEEVSCGDHEVSIHIDSYKDLFCNIVGKGWRYLLLGHINIREKSNVNVHFFGGNMYWCDGVSFDYAGLLRVGPVQHLSSKL